MIWHFTPYSSERDLGKAYNDYMRLLPDGDAACLRDMDTLLLTPDTPQRIARHHMEAPQAVLTCKTNRIHPKATEQLLTGRLLNTDSIKEHIKIAEGRGANALQKAFGPLSGFLMVVPVAVWRQVPFREGIGLLGVDTAFFADLRAAGVEVYCMPDVYVFHSYRINNGIEYKQHLL